MAMTKTLPAGRYFIGDPCYVLDDQDWLRFCSWFDRLEAGEETEEDREEWNGVAADYTAYGDGVYSTSNGVFSVDSGMIGAVEESYWKNGKEDLDRYNELGNVVVFEDDITFESNSGTFKIFSDDYNYLRIFTNFK